MNDNDDAKKRQGNHEHAWKGTWDRPMKIDEDSISPFTVARMTDHNVRGSDEDVSMAKPDMGDMREASDMRDANMRNPTPDPPLSQAKVIELKSRIKAELAKMGSKAKKAS